MVAKDATELNQNKSWITEIYREAYLDIESYVTQGSKFKSRFSKTKFRWKIISFFEFVIDIIGLRGLADKLWATLVLYVYETNAINTATGSSFGTTFYGLTEAERYEDIYHLLADDESRDVFKWFLRRRFAYMVVGPIAADLFPYLDFERNQKLNVIKKKGGLWKIGGYLIDCRNGSEVENTWVNEQYLLSGKCEPAIGDVVIDAGGFWGETAIWFADQVGASGKVHSFEPLPGNFRKMKENIRRNGLEGTIRVDNKGLWDCETDLLISNNDSASVCSSERGDLKVQVTTLDAYVEKARLEKVDFIKMDIEGAELNALKGAVRTIGKFKPKLAISVYHRPKDIYEIPVLIKSLVPEYKFYLSHKCRGWNETVLFAVIDDCEKKILP